MKILNLFFVIVFLSVFLLSFAMADDKNFLHFTGYASFVSEYVWRGFDILNGHPAFQPGATFGFGDTGIYFDYWSSYAITNRTDEEHFLDRFDEIDLTLGINRSLKELTSIPVSLQAGGIAYIFPNLSEDDFTWELFAGLTFDEIICKPYIKFYYDFELGDNYYMEVGSSHGFPVFGKYELVASAALGYNGGQYETDAGISNIPLSLYTTINIDILAITPSVSYIFTPDESVNEDNGEFVAAIKGAINI